MSDKLRSFHKGVCHAWRKQSEPHISEAEADLLDAGLHLLEKLVDRSSSHWLSPEDANREIVFTIARYIRRVKTLFGNDSDIYLKEDTTSE